MHWLLAVLIGHFLNAVSYVLDKVLLTKSIKDPFAFTFFIGVLGLAAVVMIPLGFDVPSGQLIALNLITGSLFSAALLFMFLALQGSETSRVIPFIGGGIPVFTLIFEILFLDGQLSSAQLAAFAVLVLGTVVIAIEFKDKKDKQPFEYKTWLYGISAALFFAISFGLTKVAFDNQEFFSAFIWMRFGSVILPLTFLLWKSHRETIFESIHIFKEKAGLLYLVAQGFGAGGFIFVNYAISMASVSLVNALQGTQYAFLLIMAVIGTVKYPKLLMESMTRKSLVTKIIAVVIIGIGLYMISQAAYA